LLLGFSCVADDNGAAVMMVIRALLHHFKHVSAIWCEVLPTNIYLRSVGKLMATAALCLQALLSWSHILKLGRNCATTNCYI